MTIAIRRPRFALLLLMTCGAAILVGCSGGTDPTDPADTVTVALAATGLTDGKLTLNATAAFTATVTGFTGDASGLGYRWTLSTDRGELSDGTDPLPSPTLGGPAMACVGKTGGDERITVAVLSAAGDVLATAATDFTIIPPIDPGEGWGCFDQPKIYFLNTNFRGYMCNYDGSDEESFGVVGALSCAISPDGEWIATCEADLGGYQVYVTRCDGSTGWIWIEEGGVGEDFIPEFSQDSRTLYFLRPEPTQPDPFNAFRLPDIAAYDLETGEVRFVTTLHQSGESVGDFAVSPLTGEIAFTRQSYEELPDGSYAVHSMLSFVDPETGVIRDFLALTGGVSNQGLDWSPDGGHIIFSGGGDQGVGIYRLELTDGSQPLRIFPQTSEVIDSPHNPRYYADGDRIVFGHSGNGATTVDLWTIDANGGDPQLLLDYAGNIYLMGVLH